MARTLANILTDANAVLDLVASAPTGDELATRTNYANQAVLDASATGQLTEFKREFLTTTSTLATIPLPANFRELQESPRILNNGAWEEYTPIEIEQKYDMPSSQRYCYVLGNPAEGYNLVFNNIIASATLSVIYQRYASGLLTLADQCELSDPQYVVRKIESYVLYSRSDDRFPIAEQRAQQTLANMMGREMKGTTGNGKSTKMTFKNPLQ
jgi:hypothetical protein